MLGRLVEGDDFRAANGGVKLGWDEIAFFVQVTKRSRTRNVTGRTQAQMLSRQPRKPHDGQENPRIRPGTQALLGGHEPGREVY